MALCSVSKSANSSAKTIVSRYTPSTLPLRTILNARSRFWVSCGLNFARVCLAGNLYKYGVALKCKGLDCSRWRAQDGSHTAIVVTHLNSRLGCNIQTAISCIHHSNHIVILVKRIMEPIELLPVALAASLVNSITHEPIRSLFGLGKYLSIRR